MLPFTLKETTVSMYPTTKPKLDQLLKLDKKLGTLLDLCVSSLRRGHANLLCIVPILSDDPRRESNRDLQNRVMGLEGTQKNTLSNEFEHELFIFKKSQSYHLLKYVNIKTSCPENLIVLGPYELVPGPSISRSAKFSFTLDKCATPHQTHHLGHSVITCLQPVPTSSPASIVGNPTFFASSLLGWKLKSCIGILPRDSD